MPEQIDKDLARLIELETFLDETPPGLKVLLVAGPGVGKTKWLTTGEKIGLIPHILDVDNSTVTITGSKGKRIPYTTYDDALLWAGCMRDSHPHFADYGIACIDTATHLQDRELDQYVEWIFKQPKYAGKRSRFTPQIEDFNVSTNKMRRLLDDLKMSPKHVIVTAHTVKAMNEETGKVEYSPAFTAKLAQTITGYFDIVCYIRLVGDEKNAKRVIYFQPVDKQAAKTRIEGLPDSAPLDEWPFSRLVEMMIAQNERNRIKG